ncbi:MAG: stealth conserved region 3 domain-containing protein, partial [Chloroflexota bacterium]
EAAPSLGQRAYVQIPGRCLPLTDSTIADRLSDIETRPRLRLMTADADGRITQNVAIELWKHANRAYRSLSDDSDVRLTIPAAAPPAAGPAPIESSVDEPIDVVYTWVDAADSDWRVLAAPYLDLASLEQDLYTQTGELRYSLRSLETFAPWVDHVYVLSNCAPPAWFMPTPRVSWIDHDEIADANLLPLFNSGAIDTLLHRIPGLSERFLYMNDDFMLWDSVTPASFFTWDGRSVARMATNSSLIYLQQLVEAGEATPSQHSRVNAARLMRQRYGVFPTRVHGHVPYALRRSVLEQMEHDFSDEMAATRASRSRSATDVSFIAYLYHHYAYLNGAAVYADAPQSFVTVHNYQRHSMRRALGQTPFACFQDSRGSATDGEYQAYKREALQAALPLRASSEQPANPA